MLELYKQIPPEKRSPQIGVDLLKKYLEGVTSLIAIVSDGSTTMTVSNVKQKSTFDENSYEMIVSESTPVTISSRIVFICTDVCQPRVFASSLSRFLRCILILNRDEVSSIRFELVISRPPTLVCRIKIRLISL